MDILRGLSNQMSSINEDIKDIRGRVYGIEDPPPPLANIITHAHNLAADTNDYSQGLCCTSHNATSTFTGLGSPTKSMVVSVVTDGPSKTSPAWRLDHEPFLNTPTHAADAHDATSILTGLGSLTKNPNSPYHNMDIYSDAGDLHGELHATRTRATAHYDVGATQPWDDRTAPFLDSEAQPWDPQMMPMQHPRQRTPSYPSPTRNLAESWQINSKNLCLTWQFSSTGPQVPRVT